MYLQFKASLNPVRASSFATKNPAMLATFRSQTRLGVPGSLLLYESVLPENAIEFHTEIINKQPGT